MLDILISFVAYGGSLSLLYVVTLLAYRLFFHPYSHIPGPPIAKATYLYEWYYDLYLSGQFTFELKALHKKYGIYRHSQLNRGEEEEEED